MTILGEVMSSARPQLLFGFFIGICLSSAVLQFVLLSLGMKGIGNGFPLGQSSTSPSSPEEQLLIKKRAALYQDSNYEVHNLGLKLHSADSGNQYGGDSHVVKYFPEEQLPVRFDSLLHSGEYLKDAIMADGSEGRKKLVYTGVLTDRSRLTDQAAVIRMTWGSELSAVQFFYDLGDDLQSGRSRREHVREIVGLPDVSAGEVFTSAHTLETLRHVCSRHHDEFLWYVIVRDATYVHTSGLMRILDRLSPSEDLIIGQMNSAHDGVCSASEGVILSSRALSRVCTRIYKCSGKPNVEQCLGMQCVSSKKIAPAFHVTARGGHVDVGQLVSDIKDNDLPQLTDQSVFVGTLPYTRDFYRLHLHFTRVKIAKTQEEIQRLGQELSRTRRSVRPKRDKSLLRVQETAIFGQDALLNKTSEPFYQFIDNSGNMYLDTCKVRKQDVGKDGFSPYNSALQMAKNSLDANINTDTLDFFSYKVTKPNVGIEYQFYFIQTLTHNPTIGNRRKPPKEKVYQVTVLHPYDKLEMESKDIQLVRKINFIVATNKGTASLKRFLLNYEQICLSKGIDRCSLLIIIYKNDRDPSGNTGVNTKDIRRALVPLEEKYPGMGSQVLEVQGESQTLARTVQMADSAFDRDDLLAFLHPDATFTEDFLYRCQLNTQAMKRAYFPVVFQKYGHVQASSVPNIPTQINETDANNEGYWANSEYTSFCAYNEDIQLFDNLPSSPRDLHNMFKASEYMGVFRAPDPGLTMSWGSHICSMSNSIDRSNCVKELKYMNMQ